MSVSALDTPFLIEQRAAYEEKRKADAVILYNQLKNSSTATKNLNKSARLARIITRHKIII